eukprot:scaffold113104_cov18-Tisochrysis_lutea.AAC.1
MNIPSISSGSDSDEEPIFSSFNWDAVQVRLTNICIQSTKLKHTCGYEASATQISQFEEPGFGGVSSNQRRVVEEPPVPRSSASLLSSASPRTTPIIDVERHSKFAADDDSQNHWRQQQARQVSEPEPLVPSTSPHAEVPTLPDRLQSMGWFSGAAGRMADVFSP